MSMPSAEPLSSLRILTAVVEDHPGVLTRVAGMVRRRGFNIQGLSVGPTDEHGRSRMTLTVDAGHAEVDQVQKQLKVRPGDEIVTAGTRNARYPDLYPYGIPIGRVSPG